MKISDCEICAALPAFAAADLRDGQRLPEAAARLVDARPTPEGFWDAVKEYALTKTCPLCGRLYAFSYYYEFSVGYVEERVWLERLADGPAPDAC